MWVGDVFGGTCCVCWVEEAKSQILFQGCNDRDLPLKLLQFCSWKLFGYHLIASTRKPSHSHLEAANYAIEGTFQASEASHLFGIQKHRKLGYNTEVKILRGSHG